MAKEYESKGFKSIFVYTREAHPGEHYPAHRSIEQKISQAMAFKQILGVERPILVDDVVGTGHNLYGTLPNMTHIVARGNGRVLFRADWTDPPTIKNALDYILDCRTRRHEGVRLTPFYSEIVGYRWSDHAKQAEALARAGPQAVEDMATAMQRRGRGPRPGFISLDS
jgi:hypothetical protein